MVLAVAVVLRLLRIPLVPSVAFPPRSERAPAAVATAFGFYAARELLLRPVFGSATGWKAGRRTYPAEQEIRSAFVTLELRESRPSEGWVERRVPHLRHRDEALHFARCAPRVRPCWRALPCLASAASSLAMTPNDPAFSREWGPRLTHASDLWDRTTGDRRIVIAVLDTGVAPIPELRVALVPGWDFVEDDATPQDTFGHGTWVASAIAAQGDNGLFGAGYCWGCGLMPVRVSDGHVAADTGVIARAIRWAVDHGARIITISLTGQGDDPVERAAVDYATAHNVLVVASAGNTGDDENVYPAAYPGVLSVTGTDPRDRLYKWSARGAWIRSLRRGARRSSMS